MHTPSLNISSLVPQRPDGIEEGTRTSSSDMNLPRIGSHVDSELLPTDSAHLLASQMRMLMEKCNCECVCVCVCVCMCGCGCTYLASWLSPGDLQLCTSVFACYMHCHTYVHVCIQTASIECSFVVESHITSLPTFSSTHQSDKQSGQFISILSECTPTSWREACLHGYGENVETAQPEPRLPSPTGRGQGEECSSPTQSGECQEQWVILQVRNVPHRGQHR